MKVVIDKYSNALTVETGGVLWTGDKKLYSGLKERGFDKVVNLNDLEEIL